MTDDEIEARRAETRARRPAACSCAECRDAGYLPYGGNDSLRMTFGVVSVPVAVKNYAGGHRGTSDRQAERR